MIAARQNAAATANKIRPSRLLLARICSGVRCFCEFRFIRSGFGPLVMRFAVIVLRGASRIAAYCYSINATGHAAGIYSTCGGCSNVWNGAGLGTVHSRPSAPSHGLSPAFSRSPPPRYAGNATANRKYT